MRIAIILSVIAISLILLAVRFPAILVNALAFHPSKSIPSLPGMPSSIEELTLTASDGTQLQAFLHKHPTSKRLILFFHGNAGNAYGRLGDLHMLAKETASNVLLLSYRGYGKSEGSPNEQGVYLDAEAALLYAKNALGFDERHIFLLGRSLGSAVAINLAQQRALAGLILVSPLTSGQEMAKVMGLGWMAGIAGAPLNSIDKVSNISSPALFIHGDADKVIPIEMGLRLFEAYPGAQKTFQKIPGAGHNDIVAIAGPAYWTWMRSFMDEVQQPS